MVLAVDSVLYDPRSGRYRGADGRFISREKILSLVEQEGDRTSIRLQGQMRLLIAGKIDLAEWEVRSAQTLKDSHIRLMTLAAGGRDRLTPQHYGTVGYELKRQYAFLDKFAHDLAAGKLTPSQALRRASSYAKSGKISFYKAEAIARKREGFTVGKRLLDPQAQHCPSCRLHERRDWVPIDQIVSPGTRCECQNNCRCRVEYRKLGLSDRISGVLPLG